MVFFLSMKDWVACFAVLNPLGGHEQMLNSKTPLWHQLIQGIQCKMGETNPHVGAGSSAHRLRSDHVQRF